MTKQILRACAVFFFLAFLIGCGPTRKEYAINEALLVDQTRMLEDQLYRAHFEIQYLQDENASLRRRLGESGKAKSSPVPFDQKSVEPSPEQSPTLFPTGQAERPEDPMPMINGGYFPPTTQSQPQGAARYRVAQRGTMRRAVPPQGARPYYPPQGGQVR